MIFIDPMSLMPIELLMKLAEHADDRLRERTDLHPDTLVVVRDGVRSAPHIPRGTHHVRMPDGSYAVVKDVGHTRPRHVVATVLGPDMRPPGQDISATVLEHAPEETREIHFGAGPHQVQRGGMRATDRKRGDTHTRGQHGYEDKVHTRGDTHGRDQGAYAVREKRRPGLYEYSESRTLSSVKTSAVNEEEIKARLREIEYDAASLRNWSGVLQRQARLISVAPDKLPLKPPPANDDPRVFEELKLIQRAMGESPLTPEFVEDASDNPVSLFIDFIDEAGLDVAIDTLDALAQDLLKIAFYLKYKYRRPRPYQLAPYYGLDIPAPSNPSADSPAYPSGHAIVGFGLARFLMRAYPEYTNELQQLANNIALSRIQAGVHYPSDIVYAREVVDSVMGESRQAIQAETSAPQPAPPAEKRASVMGAGVAAATSDDKSAKGRAIAGTGGTVGGLIGNVAGVGAGLATANALGVSGDLAHGTFGESVKKLVTSPIKSVSNLGWKGTGLILGGNTLGAVVGGYLGGKAATAIAHRNDAPPKMPLRSSTPNLDQLANSAPMEEP
jgi:PAP2 superfamily